jgi:hypothetical protein
MYARSFSDNSAQYSRKWACEIRGGSSMNSVGIAWPRDEGVRASMPFARKKVAHAWVSKMMASMRAGEYQPIRWTVGASHSHPLPRA